MSIQPKILTLVIADNDIAKTYTTIRSAQGLHYRNHEIACAVPAEHHSIIPHLGRDFIWLSTFKKTFASDANWLDQVIERANSYHVDMIFFIHAGSTMKANFYEMIINQTPLYPEVGLFMPSVAHQDGKTVYAIKSQGKLPHRLYSVNSPLLYTEGEDDAHFAGGAVLIKMKIANRFATPESDSETAIFFWIESIIKERISSMALYQPQVVFDGFLLVDLLEQISIPPHILHQLIQYVNQNGNWYDKLGFRYKYAWRKEGSWISKLFDRSGVGREEYVK